MNWLQVFTIIISLGGMIYWVRKELRKDINRIRQNFKSRDKKSDIKLDDSTIATNQRK